MRSSYRLQVVPLAALPLLLAAVTALAVTNTGVPLLAIRVPMIAIVALTALAAAVIGLSLGPQVIFPVWLGLAPFIQTTTRDSPLGHRFSMIFYSAPPFMFLIWALIQRRRIRASVVDLVPALYLAFVVASVIFSGTAIAVTQANLSGSSVTLTQIYSIVAIGVITYYLCAFVELDDSFERHVAAALLLGGSIIGVLVVVGRAAGLAGNVAGFDFGSTYVLPTTGAVVQGRASALGGPGALGAFLGATFVLALAILVWGGPRSLRRLSLLALVITPPALFLTLTRAPLLAASCVGFIIIALRSRSRWPSVLALATTVIVIVAAWGSIASTSVYKNRLSDKTNIQGRELLDKWSLQLAARKPVTGWGYGSFDRVKNSANLSASSSIQRSFGLQYTSHNTFLTVLVELGIVGLCLMIVPWLVAARAAIRRARRPVPSRWAIIGFLAILGVWMINAGTFDMRFFSFTSALPWLAAGFLRRRVLSDGDSRFHERLRPKSRAT